MSDLIARARDWIDGDPDSETADALRRLIDAGDEPALQRAMGEPLSFGTAGIRGVVGPGPGQMNRAVVIRTTRGLVDFLIDREKGVPTRPVIVGFDARPTSKGFAEDTVGVLAAAGIPTVFFPEYTPTPLVSFTAKEMGAVAAVVVTASHNPPADNGYKVYDSNAAQIIPPTDAAIANAISDVGPANAVPRIEDAFSTEHDKIRRAPDWVVSRYFAEVDSYRYLKPTSSVRTVYTPLHGVGGRVVFDVFDRSIHRNLVAVQDQFEPDGTFPTVDFPNPEEPGALDMAMEVGAKESASLILANDPDADRLAAAWRKGGSWRLLTGNELGVILGSHLLENRPSTDTAITACSVVSSPLLSQIAERHGAIHLTTLTGFKWIVNAAMAVEAESKGSFLFGYEEALGYSIGRTVPDKDGISAALVLADIAALEAEKGRDILDRLGDIWREHGVWVSTQESMVRAGPSGAEQILAGVDSIAQNPPEDVGGYVVSSVEDYRSGAENRPPWLGEQPLIELNLGTSGRILTRPSGTEPKLKVYVDLRADAQDDVHAQREELLTEANRIASTVLRRIEDSVSN